MEHEIDKLKKNNIKITTLCVNWVLKVIETWRSLACINSQK